jgi:hypothetical protein
MSSVLWFAVAVIYLGLGLVNSGGMRLIFFVLAAAVVSLETYKLRRRRALAQESPPDRAE